MGINYNLAVDRLEALNLYFLCISQRSPCLCRRCEGGQGLRRRQDVIPAVRASKGLGQGMSQDGPWARIPLLPWHGRVRPRHRWRSVPFLLPAWQLPLLSPLPWQCQPGSHGVSACASARQARSHPGWRG